MKATEILMEEHRIIERVLNALETGTKRLETGGPIRPEFFCDAVEFIQKFADGLHHMKEEGVLFEVMVSHGMPKEVGPIAVMLADHVQARKFTGAIEEATEKLLAGDETATGEIIINSQGYIYLLREHIAKEDNILFPMADQAIPIDQHEAVLEAFKQIEIDKAQEGVHAKYLSLAKTLEEEMSQ